MSFIPEHKIVYKTDSALMRFLGKLMFFNKSFMTDFTTTLGHTIYLTNPQYAKLHPVTLKVTIAHELVHIRDYQRLGGFLFVLMYGCPQILAPLAILLAFLFPWWIAVLWAVVCLSPVPAYFRMQLEKKAYTFSLYAMYLLSSKYGFNIDFDSNIDHFVENFTKSNYYFMWPMFSRAYFTKVLSDMKAGLKPGYPVEYYQMVEEVMANDLKIG